MKKEHVKVTITDGFGADRALKKFKRLCDMYGIVKEYRKREAYEKPSVKAKLKKEYAEKRRLKGDSRSNKSFTKI